MLLVDFARGWTDETSPMSVPLARQLEGAARMLDAARPARCTNDATSLP